MFSSPSQQPGQHRAAQVPHTGEGGAQVNVVGEHHIAALGLTRKDLLRSQVSLDCANQTKAKLLGVFLAKITGVSVITGEGIIAHGMVYVIEGKSCLVSMVTLRDLGCVQEEFPEIGRFSWAVAALRAMTSTGHHGADGGSHGGEVVRQPPGDCDPDSPLPCSCPRRQFTDSPDMLPIPATESNRKALED